MIWLWVGIGLWSGLHFIPSLAPGIRDSLIERAGEKTYKIIFALGIVGSIALMVLGWRSTAPIHIYIPPSWGPAVTNALVLVAFLLFGLAHAQTNVKRFIQWFRARVQGNDTRRYRKITIVAMARKLLIALWRYVTEGVVPEGAVFKAA